MSAFMKTATRTSTSYPAKSSPTFDPGFLWASALFTNESAAPATTAILISFDGVTDHGRIVDLPKGWEMRGQKVWAKLASAGTGTLRIECHDTASAGA